MPEVLRAGDILITDTPWPGHAGIALTGIHLWEPGFRDLARTAVAEAGGRVRATSIYHAVNPGGVMEEGGWHQRSIVFRPDNLSFAMCEEMCRIADEIQRGARYGVARAVLKSWSSSTRFSSNARDRLAKYRERLGNHQGQVAIVKNLYCSEFVVLIYQLACAGEDDPNFININAKHTLPRDLRRWMEHHPAHWTRMGQTRGDMTLQYDPG